MLDVGPAGPPRSLHSDLLGLSKVGLTQQVPVQRSDLIYVGLRRSGKLILLGSTGSRVQLAEAQCRIAETFLASDSLVAQEELHAKKMDARFSDAAYRPLLSDCRLGQSARAPAVLPWFGTQIPRFSCPDDFSLLSQRWCVERLEPVAEWQRGTGGNRTKSQEGSPLLDR